MATFMHRCRFVEWTPEAIISLDMAPAGAYPLLAAVRNNGDLELYDASQNWSQRRIPAGGAVGRAIQSVLWAPPSPSSIPAKINLCNDKHQGRDVNSAQVRKWKEVRELPVGRLFTAGLDGTLVEWDVERQCPRRVLRIEGSGGFWCMTSSPDGSLLALGCEDSTVRIVSIKRLAVVKTLICPPGGNLLSLAWTEEEEGDKRRRQLLAVGTSTSTVLIWDYEQAKLLHKINMERQGEGETLVWAMRFAGSQLITGDSTGAVTVLAARSGAMVSSNRAQPSEILTLAVSRDASVFYASSAAGLTVEFQRYLDKGTHSKWKPTQRRANHTHDVRTSVCALIPCGGHGADDAGSSAGPYRQMVISGGVDGSIALYDPTSLSSSAGEARRLPRSPQQSLYCLAREAKIIAALSGPSTLRLWKLIRVDDATERCQKAPKLGQGKRGGEAVVGLDQLSIPPARQLLQINVPGGESVAHFDISPDGRLLAYTTRSAVHLLELSVKMSTRGFDPVEDVQIAKLAIPEDAAGRKGSHGVPSLVKFAPDGQSVAIVFLDGKGGESRLVRYAIVASEEDKGAGAKAPQVKEKQSIQLTSSAAVNLGVWEGRTLAMHDLANHVTLVDMEQAKVLPASFTPESWVQALRLVTEDRLVLVTAEKHLYNVECFEKTRRKTATIRPHTDLPSRWTKNGQIIAGIACAPPLDAGKGRKGGEEKAAARLLLWSDRCITRVDLDQPLPTRAQGAALRKARSRAAKCRDHPSSDDGKALQAQIEAIESAMGGNLVENRGFSLILGLEYLTADELVLIERPEEALLASLPPAERRRRFGGF